jgi:hypothetical protein
MPSPDEDTAIRCLSFKFEFWITSTSGLSSAPFEFIFYKFNLVIFLDYISPAQHHQ